MIGRSIAQYRIVEKLGGGGMGVVYRAEDGRLRRSVALKFLPPGLTSDKLAKERFLREARAASALDHPNICTIFEIDETDDGQLFIAMACYQGETLGRKLERGPLPLAEALDVAVQACRGLHRGHRQGIIHRDVKPANVMITEHGEVKILDFGLAKLVDEKTLTESGGIAGTISYMAPEQLGGGPLDHRVDIWAMGALTYQMVSGSPPFPATRPEAAIYSILRHHPPLLDRVVGGVPGALAELIDSMLAKDPDHRPQSFEQVMATLEQIRSGDSSTPVTRTQSWPTQTPSAGVAGHAEPSIAVLPFADMSPGRDQEYFCEGIAEEILNALSRVDGLRVAARTAAFQFKGVSADVREIGRRLHVNTLLEGSVRKAGNRIRITVQLVDVEDGYQLWSDTYDRELEDIFAIQEEIARAVAGALRLVLSEQQRRALKPASAVDIHAYEYYLRGRQSFWRGGRGRIEQGQQMFAQAIAIDPDFARAYAGLADCHCWLYYWYRGGREALEAAEAASARAVELAPHLAEAHAGRGHALSLSGRFEEAEQEFEAALRLDPRLFEAYWFFGRVCFAQGKLERAVELWEKGAAVRPEDFQTLIVGSSAYRGMGRLDDYRSALRRGLERARAQVELEPDNLRALALGGTALMGLGEPDEGREWIRRSIERGSEDPSSLFNAACAFAVVGDHEEALDTLEQAIEAGIRHRDWLEHDSDLDSIRDHPRFKELLSRL